MAPFQYLRKQRQEDPKPKVSQLKIPNISKKKNRKKEIRITIA
jgi:hypothetical protein